MEKLFTKDYGSTAFITGMRAFAVLMVVLIHAGGGGFRDLGAIGNNIADFGRTGVYVFFVISGFSVTASYSSSAGYLDYINKRLWRIAPLYYFWLIMAVALGVTSTAWQKEFDLNDISLYNWLLHIFFLGFLDYKLTNSIIGVEWSISIEVFWYFLIPVIIYYTRTNWRLALIIFISFFVYKIAQKHPGLLPVNPEKAALAMHWSPIPYFFSFVLGVAAYKIRSKIFASKFLADAVFSTSLLLLIIHFYAPNLTNRFLSGELVLTSILTALIIIFGTEKSMVFKLLFCNKISQLLGVLSYGIYLNHVPIMGILISLDVYGIEHPVARFAMVAGLSIFVSMISYLIIEKKFNVIGREFGFRYLPNLRHSS